MTYLFSPLLIALVALAPAVPPKSPVSEVQSEVKTEHAVSESVACSCVRFVVLRGGNIPLIDASRIKPSTTTPSVGAVAVEYFPRSGLHHVSHVVAVGTSTVDVVEANYRPCEITYRTINLASTRLLGFR